MSTNTTGAAAPAQTTTTTETETSTPVIPGRDEVLKAFAREAMGEPETAAPPAKADTENADEALSQLEPETTTETPEEVAAREAQEAEAAAAEEPNHLEDDLRAELPEEVQQAVNRRIGKEVAKTKTEREQREAAEAKVAELETKLAETPVRTPSKVPLADVHDMGKLSAEKAKAEEALEQAEDLLLTLEDDPASVEAELRAQKIELKADDGSEDFSEARMKKFLRTVKTNADRTLRSAIPKREEFLKQAEQHAYNAVALMPELKDKASERAKLFQQVVREMPEIQRRPDWPLMAVAGVKAMEWMKEAVAAKTAAKTATPPKKREVPVTIPAPRAQATSTRAKAPVSEDVNTVADKVLSGDKSARLKVLQGFVPKMK